MITKILTVVFAVVALALAGPAIRHLRERPPDPPPVTRLQLPIPQGVSLGAGLDGLDAAIAPDERRVAVVATKDGETSLWLVTLDDGAARPVPSTGGASLPTWRPDGGALAFFTGGELRSLTLAPERTTTIAVAPRPAGASWLADGSIVFVADANAPIRRWANGSASDVTRLRAGDTGHAWPFIDDEGQLIYVALRQDGTRVVRRQRTVAPQAAPTPTSADTVDLTLTASHAEVRNGMLVHMRDDVLLAQRLDESGTRLVGRSAALATSVGISVFGRGQFATSARVVIWSPTVRRDTDLAWYDRAGRRLETVTEPGDYWQVRVSPNGRDVAVAIGDPLLRTLDVQAVPFAAPGTARRVSLSLGPDSDPVWSPDAVSILYRSTQGGPGSLMLRPAGPSSAPEMTVLRSASDVTPSDWREGTILFHASTNGTIQVMSMDRRGGPPQAVTAGVFHSWGARWSPDGRWIAFVSDESGQPEVYVQAWPSGTPRVRATFGGGQRPQWGSNTTLMFQRRDTLMHATFVAATRVVSTPQALFDVAGLRDFALSPVNSRVLVVGAAGGTRPLDAFVVLDWISAVPPPPRPPPRL